MELKPGQLLGSYRIEERMVSGGMAKVYRALQPSTNREVAIKVLPAMSADPAAVARFEREMRVVAGLQHPHILGLIDAGRQGPWHYLVLPLARRGDLGDLIAREGRPLPLAVARRVTLQLCEALEYAHAQGIVHRDLKPDNVLLDERGNCLLTDFGIAMADGAERLTLAGQAVGTPEYLAPEQAAGLADARSDLYALGVILFQMVTGRMPFEAHTAAEWLQAHRESPAPSPRTFNVALPPPLDAVILKALAKQPADRYRSAAEFAAALREALPEAEYVDRSTRVSSPTVMLPGTGRPAQRKAWPLVAAVGAIALVAALAVWRASVPPRASAPVATNTTAGSAPAIATTESAATQPTPPAAPPTAPLAASDDAAAPTHAPEQSSTVPSDADVYDDFDNRRFAGRYDPSRWQPTRATARMRFEQNEGSLHIQSREREDGLYAEFAATRLAQVTARVRMNAPVTASQASLGVTLSRLDDPGRWVSCYVYAVRGSATGTPACTDQRRSEFRTGRAAALDSWHEVSLQVDDASARVLLSLDGDPVGELPFAAHGAGTWYVLLSGWSADGQAVEGDVDHVSVARGQASR